MHRLISSSGKIILITGAGGFLGGELIEQLYKKTSYTLFTLTSNKEKLLSRFSYVKNLKCFNMKDFKDNVIPWNKIDTIIHCAFARGYQSDREIAESLAFTNELFHLAAIHHVSSLINISSQGVYGQEFQPLWNENTPVAPNNNYGLAKYASEILSHNAKIISNNHMNISNIRLASLSGGKEGLVPEVISKFVMKVLKAEPIKIIGGNQVLSYMDVRDAAAGIISLLSVNPKNRREIYNLGNNEYFTLIEIANIVANVSKKYTTRNTKIEIEEKDLSLNVGMDASAFYKDTNWRPQFDMVALIDSLFKFFTKYRIERGN